MTKKLKPARVIGTASPRCSKPKCPTKNARDSGRARTPQASDGNSTNLQASQDRDAEILGIAPQIHNESWTDLASKMIAGDRDALATMAGAPFPAVEDLEKTEPITFIGLSSDQVDSVRKAMPELSSSTLPARTYPSLEKDYVTFGVYNFMIARDDLPDDLVYQVVKTVHENQARLVAEHAQ
jgi:TRAP transporter TAXI family solute receptor